MKVGDKIPLFELPDKNGKIHSIENYLGDKKLVIYFYPKDDTPGCTKEACSFRDAYEDFVEMGCEVIGISSDDVETHKQFSDKHNLPFLLLADEKNVVRKLFKVPRNLFGLIPGRVTYVVNENGVVVKIFDSLFQAEKHIEEAKKTVSEM